jgi:hypothetical protein
MGILGAAWMTQNLSWWATALASATQVAGSPIAYTPDAYPCFFIDTNGNGEVDGEEGAVPNAYKSWTP